MEGPEFLRRLVLSPGQRRRGEHPLPMPLTPRVEARTASVEFDNSIAGKAHVIKVK